jgi:hypothetical protein
VVARVYHLLAKEAACVSNPRASSPIDSDQPVSAAHTPERVNLILGAPDLVGIFDFFDRTRQPRRFFDVRGGFMRLLVRLGRLFAAIDNSGMPSHLFLQSLLIKLECPTSADALLKKYDLAFNLTDLALPR